MKRLLVSIIISALAVGMTGCRQCNWFGRPSAPAVPPDATYSLPTTPIVPSTSPAPCGPGGNCCPGGNSCGGNTLPMFSDAQGYTSASTN